MTTVQRDRLLLTGIPGTGKTCYGNKFRDEFGFAHYDLEDQPTLNLLYTDSARFFSNLLSPNKHVVVTWGFNPEDPASLELLAYLRSIGFKLIWFDGNRPAAMQAFRNRHTVSEEALAAQMQRIERNKIIEELKPIVINTFDERGQFKPAAQVLEEIRNA